MTFKKTGGAKGANIAVQDSYDSRKIGGLIRQDIEALTNELHALEELENKAREDEIARVREVEQEEKRRRDAELARRAREEEELHQFKKAMRAAGEAALELNVSEIPLAGNSSPSIKTAEPRAHASVVGKALKEELKMMYIELHELQDNDYIKKEKARQKQESLAALNKEERERRVEEERKKDKLESEKLRTGIRRELSEMDKELNQLARENTRSEQRRLIRDEYEQALKQNESERQQAIRGKERSRGATHGPPKGEAAAVPALQGAPARAAEYSPQADALGERRRTALQVKPTSRRQILDSISNTPKAESLPARKAFPSLAALERPTIERQQTIQRRHLLESTALRQGNPFNESSRLSIDDPLVHVDVVLKAHLANRTTRNTLQQMYPPGFELARVSTPQYILDMRSRDTRAKKQTGLTLDYEDVQRQRQRLHELEEEYKQQQRAAELEFVKAEEIRRSRQNALRKREDQALKHTEQREHEHYQDFCRTQSEDLKVLKRHLESLEAEDDAEGRAKDLSRDAKISFLEAEYMKQHVQLLDAEKHIDQLHHQHTSDMQVLKETCEDLLHHQRSMELENQVKLIQQTRQFEMEQLLAEDFSEEGPREEQTLLLESVIEEPDYTIDQLPEPPLIVEAQPADEAESGPCPVSDPPLAAESEVPVASEAPKAPPVEVAAVGPLAAAPPVAMDFFEKFDYSYMDGGGDAFEPLSLEVGAEALAGKVQRREVELEAVLGRLEQEFRRAKGETTQAAHFERLEFENRRLLAERERLEELLADSAQKIENMNKELTVMSELAQTISRPTSSSMSGLRSKGVGFAMQNSAAIRIQCAWRQRCARKAVRRLKIERRRSYQGLNKKEAGRVILKFFRSVMAKKASQARERRSIAAQKNELKKKKNEAALIIQCAWRQREARQEMYNKRAGAKSSLKKFTSNEAAIIIARFFRQAKAHAMHKRRRTAKIEAEKGFRFDPANMPNKSNVVPTQAPAEVRRAPSKDGEALKIQCAWRQKQARGQLASRRSQFAAYVSSLDENAAAVIITRFFRVVKAKRDVLRAEATRSGMSVSELENFKARRRLLPMRIRFRGILEDEAAAMIENNWRVHHARVVVTDKKAARNPRRQGPTTAKESAILIQSAWRSALARTAFRAQIAAQQERQRRFRALERHFQLP